MIKTSQSLLQPDGERECFITGFQNNLEKHHVMHGTANRKIAEQWGCWCWLTHDKHMEVHFKNKGLDRYLQKECQKAFEKKYGRKKFMELFKKNYLDEEEEQ